MNMTTEIDVLEDITATLDRLQIQYMLTGSFAMAFYAKPRMTRDIDIVLAIRREDVAALQASLANDYYLDPDAARDAIDQQRLFNLMHFATGLKIDFIVRKSSAYRRTEFDRRQRVRLGSLEVWVVSREDLILSKLEWAKQTNSELQRNDIRQLLEDSLDSAYLRQWAHILSVDAMLEDLTR